MCSKSCVSVSFHINTGPLELLRLQPSELIASESVWLMPQAISTINRETTLCVLCNRQADSSLNSARAFQQSCTKSKPIYQNMNRIHGISHKECSLPNPATPGCLPLQEIYSFSCFQYFEILYNCQLHCAVVEHCSYNRTIMKTFENIWRKVKNVQYIIAHCGTYGTDIYARHQKLI